MDFKKGDKVKILKEWDFGGDYSVLYPGDIATVDSDNYGSSVHVRFDKNLNQVRHLTCEWFELVTEKIPEEDVKLWHVMKITSSDVSEFKKLGDFFLTRIELEQWLWDNFKGGTYIVKAKNEKVGEIFTLENSASFRKIPGLRKEGLV